MKIRHQMFAALAFAGVLALIVPEADAGERTRTRQMVRNPGTGGSASVNASGSHARGDYQRNRQWQTDGAGNTSGSRSASASGIDDGSAQRQGSFQRAADGSAYRQSSGSFTGPNGAQGNTTGSYTRSADGASGSRNRTLTGPDGNTYQGQTRYERGDGSATLTHSTTCTTAAGEVVNCRD